MGWGRQYPIQTDSRLVERRKEIRVYIDTT